MNAFPTLIRARSKQRGMSLVEIMVALTISLLLLAGVIQIFLSSKQTYNMQEGLSRLQESARFAVDRLAHDASTSGHMGCLESTGNIINTLSIQTAAYDFGTAIDGANDSGPRNSDSITIRRATGGSSIAITGPMANQTAPLQLDDTDPDYARLQQYDVLTISDCSSAAVFMITNDPSASGGTIEHVAGVVSPSGSPNPGQSNSTDDLQHIFGASDASVASTYSAATFTYSIGTSASGTAAGGTCSDATPQFCALFRNGDELVEGVENMQVLFGEDTDGNPGADQYVAANGVTDWDRVVSAQITLTVNSVQRVKADGNGLISRDFTRIIRVRNRS